MRSMDVQCTVQLGPEERYLADGMLESMTVQCAVQLGVDDAEMLGDERVMDERVVDEMEQD